MHSGLLIVQIGRPIVPCDSDCYIQRPRTRSLVVPLLYKRSQIRPVPYLDYFNYSRAPNIDSAVAAHSRLPEVSMARPFVYPSARQVLN